MLRLSILLLLAVAVIRCDKPRGTAINVQIDDSVFIAEPLLTLGETAYKIDLDTMGCAELDLGHVPQPVIGTFRYGNYRFSVYIEDKKSLNIYLNVRPGTLGLEFQGENALKNEIVNGKFMDPANLPDFSKNEKEFIENLQKVMRDYARILDSLRFDDSFSALMQQKLKFRTYALLGRYPREHARKTEQQEYRPSDYYLSCIDSLIHENDPFADMYECREAMLEWVNARALAEPDLRPYPILKNKLGYIRDNIKNRELVEFLVNKYVVDYVSANGIDSLGDIKNIYDSAVKSPLMKEEFKNLCDEWKRIGTGQLSPSFDYISADSSRVKLEDLKGQYVYIEIWTMGCPQSLQELQHFRELTRRFKDKNITFVAVCCGNTLDSLWTAEVQRGNFGGIQLHTDGDTRFLEVYRVGSVPHSILLDTDNRIIDADMSRPSSPATSAALKELGI